MIALYVGKSCSEVEKPDKSLSSRYWKPSGNSPAGAMTMILFGIDCSEDGVAFRWIDEDGLPYNIAGFPRDTTITSAEV